MVVYLNYDGRQRIFDYSIYIKVNTKVALIANWAALRGAEEYSFMLDWGIPYKDTYASYKAKNKQGNNSFA